MPLTNWLTLMLAEIEQKGAESDVANDERKRRENDGGPDGLRPQDR
ncbi:MAG: hypothetical protein WD448_06465 [Woeseia sp.]